jgi:hypothetical protein
MRTVVILLVVGVLGGVFAMQKRSEPKPAATVQARAESAAPRQVSEHDWAKQSLDRAAQVKRDVLRQRAGNKDSN